MAVQISGNDITVPRDGSFTRNVTIGGTLTYEDVTNIDSVGLVTARTGIEIGARPGVAASISVDGNMIVSGISTFGGTANFAAISGTTGTFSGDVDIADKIVHTGDTNTAIRFPAADTFSVETGGSERARVSSDGNLGIGTVTPSGLLHTHAASGTNRNYIEASAGNAFLRVKSGSTSNNSGIEFNSGSSNTANVTGLGAGGLQFEVGGSERFRIASDGEVFIGEGFGDTNRSTLLSISGDYQEATGAWAQMGLYSSDSYAQNKGGSLVFGGQDGSTAKQYFAGIAGVKENTTSGDYAGNMKFYTRPAGSTPVERMRIHSAGCLSVGTSPSSTYWTDSKMFVENTTGNVAVFSHSGSDDNYPVTIRNNRANGGTGATMIYFAAANGTNVGTIQANGSSTTYNTSSDYRLKENAAAISDGITRLKTLKPYRFNFKSDSTKTVDGFFAHEVTAVPESITGTKDAVVTQAMLDSGDAPSESNLNDPIYQSIDHSKLVPLLTAALQEAVAKIEVLESEVAALKGS